MPPQPLPDDPVILRRIYEDAALLAAEMDDEINRVRDYNRLGARVREIIERYGSDVARLERKLRANPDQAQAFLKQDAPVLRQYEEAKRKLTEPRPASPEYSAARIRIQPFRDLLSDPASTIVVQRKELDLSPQERFG
jgi:hypothetical protein